MNYRHMDSPQGPPPSYHSRWDDAATLQVECEDSKGAEQNLWKQQFQLVRARTMPILEKVPPYFRNDFVPAMKKFGVTKQIYAMLLLVAFAIVPCVVMFKVASAPFSDKILDCGQLYYSDSDSNSTIKGIQGLFVIDQAYGTMSFSLVKFIDVLWDLFVGRGVQLIAWYISYVVFTDALLRVIERHPAPYRTFTLLCLEGATLASMGALIKDMKRFRSRRSTWLFAYIILATFWVLSLPTTLSAMTGYVSTSEAFVALRDDDSSEIVPLNDFINGYQVSDGSKIGLSNGSCADIDLFRDYTSMSDQQNYQCDCKLSNGTMVNHTTSYSIDYELMSDCSYNYTNNTQMFSYPSSYYHYNDGRNQNYSCNYLYNVTINNHTFKFDSLNLAYSKCYNGSAYDTSYLSARSICMPNSANDTYRWGFSTMLSAVFVIVQLIWALSLYVVWQDAQWNSVLVRGGYKMTQLRAAFSVSEAAQQRMGMENEELMRAEHKDLERRLYGRKTLVDYGMWERKKLPFMGENEASSSSLRT